MIHTYVRLNDITVEPSCDDNLSDNFRRGLIVLSMSATITLLRIVSG